MSYRELTLETLEGFETAEPSLHEQVPAASRPDLDSYDRFVVFFSGGKDSIACVLHLLERGVPRDKIELHHHNVDGEAVGGKPGLMDWPVTLAYCEAFARAMGVEHTVSYREGGIEREMLRNESRTAPVVFFKNGERVAVGGVRGPLGTRRRFPQQSASLSVRWCSASNKIDVGVSYLRNVLRFRNSRTLVITGERAEESSARAKYAAFEPDRADNRNGESRRHIDHWRPVQSWSEKQVWEILERFSINAHPAYFLGFSRCSCLSCVFGNKNQWATVRQVAPEGFERIAAYEDDFGVTIHRKLKLRVLADGGTPYPAAQGDMIRIAMSTTYDEPIVMSEWRLPAGAYGESAGPT